MKFENSIDAKQERANILEKMDALLQKRKAEKRGFTTDEANEYDNLKLEFDHVSRQVLELERSEHDSLKRAGGNPLDDDAINRLRGSLSNNAGDHARDKTEFYDQATQKPVKVFRSADRFSDVYENPNKLSVGKAIRGLISGDWGGAEEEKRTLSTGSNSGLLVPLGVFSSVIDQARAASIAAKAGAGFIPMDAGEMSLIRVSDSDGFEVKDENSAFTGGTVTFDPIRLTPFTLGTVVVLSRELAQDAMNAAAAIERALADGVADFLDKLIFSGSGDGEPLGLLLNSSLNTLEAGGAVGYGHLLRAWSLVKGYNAVNPSIVSSPDIAAQFGNLYIYDSGHGAGFMKPPSIIEQMPWHVSSNVPENMGIGEDQTGMLVGDFAQLLIGVRNNAMVEISHEAGDLFGKHQTAVKITMRVDFAPMRPKHFTRVTAIEGLDEWWTSENNGYPLVGESAGGD